MQAGLCANARLMNDVRAGTGPNTRFGKGYSDAGALGCAVSTRIFAMRLASISTTVRRRSSYSTVSPTLGICPRRASTNPARVSTPPSRGRLQCICVSRSRRFTLPSITTVPPALLSTCCDDASNSSSSSPASCSIASSAVTSPTVDPYSSTAMARCRRFCLKSRSRSSADFDSGTTSTSCMIWLSRTSPSGASGAVFDSRR